MVFANNLLAGAAAGLGGAGYTPAGAIWLDGSSDYLQWTPGGAADSNTVYTASCWVKRSGLGTNQRVLVAGDVATGNNIEWIYFDTSDKLHFELMLSAVTKYNYVTTAVYRDTTAWTHIHIKRSGATVTISINGLTVTAWDTAVAPGAGDAAMWMQASEPTTVSYQPWGGTNRYNGYISEAIMLDGVASDVTNFGVYDTKGNWVPKDPTGLTFGTNGFWLDFADSADLGNDVSGNNNDFTPTSMSA
ncbi:MAG: LamG-like jellyroll fold domain-containing protein, partial [Pelagibacteraceae bacterium]